MNHKTKMLVGLFIIGIVLVSGCSNETTAPPDCNEMKDPVERNSCFAAMGMMAMVEGNLGKCDEIQKQEDKDYCYYGLGRAMKDKSICNKIQNEGVKRECLNKIAE